jgi:hypothetical protein
MPLWVVYHPPSLFSTDSERETFAKDIQEKLYGFLPPFYVVVNYIASAQQYGGGNHCPHMVRFVISELARKNEDPENRIRRRKQMDNVLSPYMHKMEVDGKKVDWEYHVDTPPRDLWEINGLTPPMPNTEAEKLWTRLNMAVPYDEQGREVEL